MRVLSTLSVAAAWLFAVAAAEHGHIARGNHHAIAERSSHHLQKRFNGRATFYKTGLGACGKTNNDGDFIVALNSAQYGGGYPGPQCFKMIKICKGSNCQKAQIVDECPTCDFGGLDMSPSLFSAFTSPDDGVFQMTWSFVDGNDDDDNKPTTTKKPDPPKTTEKEDPPTTSHKPKPTTTQEPEPTTTSTRRSSTKTTSTEQPTTSSTTEAATTSTSDAKSSATSTNVPTSASPSPTSGAGTAASGSNLVDLQQLMLAMGRLNSVAHDSN